MFPIGLMLLDHANDRIRKSIIEGNESGIYKGKLETGQLVKIAVDQKLSLIITIYEFNGRIVEIEYNEEGHQIDERYVEDKVEEEKQWGL